MRGLRLAGAAVGAAALALACSSSTAPKPSVTGVWHVTTGAFGAGTISPATFSVTVTRVTANSLAVVMPALTWSAGPKIFNGPQNAPQFSDSTMFGFAERAASPATFCDYLTFYGTTNPAKDTLISAHVAVYDTATISGVLGCVATTTGNVTITK